MITAKGEVLSCFLYYCVAVDFYTMCLLVLDPMVFPRDMGVSLGSESSMLDFVCVFLPSTFRNRRILLGKCLMMFIHLMPFWVSLHCY